MYVDAMINHHNNINANNFGHVMNMMTYNNNKCDKKEENVDEHSNVRIHGKVVSSNSMRKSGDSNYTYNNNSNNSNNIIIGNNDVMRNGKKDAITNNNNNINNNNNNVEKMSINNISTHLNNKKLTSKIMKNLEKKCHMQKEEEEARKINMRMGNVNYMMKYGPSDKIILNGMNEVKNDNMNMSDNVNLSGNNMNNTTSPRPRPALGNGSGSVSGSIPGVIPIPVLQITIRKQMSRITKVLT
ncbi:conserved Plasmodium protein, unknown function [Plasmodium sp.]|nr:conserved Plasmodium protein, unknown function [Plasmodium sp.]